ncbi:SDR family NAD(P)-dependent oxidoreductase [Acidobacteriota bacterium]
MLENKVTILTGAAGGIGSETARLFGEKGAILVLTDIHEDRLKNLEGELNPLGVETLSVIHDVADPESWKNLIDKVKIKFGRIDILINNAGVVEPGPAEQISTEKVMQQMNVNLLGTIYGCRAVLPTLKEQDSGNIVNVASLGGIVPLPGEAVYSATKFGIRGYSFSLFAELRKYNIGVTVVCPDSVDTPQHDYELKYDDAVLSFIGSPLKPEQMAKSILKAVRKKKAEILVPTSMGLICRIGMAYPKVYIMLLPILEKLGSSEIKKRRIKKGV